jgi:hypothetical protein
MRVLAIVALLLAVGESALAQNRVGLTGGVSWERYDGNFSAVTVAVVDSSHHAEAAVGQLSLFANLSLLNRGGRTLGLGLEGGVRQFAAVGFTQRDYAPREWVSRIAGTFTQNVGGEGQLVLGLSHRGRQIEDRPPMPLFLQPAYTSSQVSGGFQLNEHQGVALDIMGDLEKTDYDAGAVLPQLDLLDVKSKGFELGATTQPVQAAWAVRFYGGFHWSDYRQQSTLDPDDPYRRDRAASLGIRWSHAPDRVEDASLGVHATVNRSNSNRPEYDALSLRGFVFRELPVWGLYARATANLTWKTYVHETSFARLVPGEEADNASLLFIDLSREVAPNLDATLRFGWTRAETDIGRSYYRRLGTSLLMTFTPSRF